MLHPPLVCIYPLDKGSFLAYMTWIVIIVGDGKLPLSLEFQVFSHVSIVGSYLAKQQFSPNEGKKSSDKDYLIARHPIDCSD